MTPIYLQFASLLLLLSAFGWAPNHRIGMYAFQDKVAPIQSNALKAPQVGGIELRSDTEGVDFGPYLHEVYTSIKKSWIGHHIPPSVPKGEQGKNTVEFHIQKDGSLPDDFLKVVLSSDKPELDAASLHAVREAAPFGHLPEKFPKPYIILRLSFFYNPSPPKSQ